MCISASKHVATDFHLRKMATVSHTAAVHAYGSLIEAEKCLNNIIVLEPYLFDAMCEIILWAKL